MSLAQQITEERRRWESSYGMAPDSVYIGIVQAEELDAMIEYVRRFGILVGKPVCPMKFDGLHVYRVDAANHLSFGIHPMSPCS